MEFTQLHQSNNPISLSIEWNEIDWEMEQQLDWLRAEEWNGATCLPSTAPFIEFMNEFKLRDVWLYVFGPVDQQFALLPFLFIY